MLCSSRMRRGDAQESRLSTWALVEVPRTLLQWIERSRGFAGDVQNFENK